MYFSRTKQSVLQTLCVAFAASVLIIYIFTSVSWLQPLACLRGGPFATTSICKGSHSSWDLFHHLGGNGPWIEKLNIDGIPRKLPESCSIQQVHLIARHAERYPTRNAGARHIALLHKLRAPHVKLRYSLSFFKDWTYFTDLEAPAFENLTNTGRYAGTHQAFKTGVRFHKHYKHLLPDNSTTRFWTCSSPRDIETARHFADGFFGKEWESKEVAKLIVVPETLDQGANTLTPGDTCVNYIADKADGHDHGHNKLGQWQKIFGEEIASRLQQDIVGLKLTPAEVYSMMELCGFEILARGSSPWCDVFTHQEWLQFEYARDLLHFYRAGPGNKYSGTMGWLWLDATRTMLINNNKEGIYMSFVHDSDIIAVVAALGILDEIGPSQFLPTDHIRTSRRWKTSDIVPMGGYMVFEKIVCAGQVTMRATPRTYMRLLINDTPYSLEDTVGSSGLNGSPTLEQFDTFVSNRGSKFGSFVDVCGLAPGSAAAITFLEQ